MAKEKKEVIVPIKGLNSRDKGYKLEDGYCTKLHNVSYRDGSWRSVKRFPKVAVYDESYNFDNYKIAYKHTILEKDEFIAYFYVENHYLYRISRVKITNNDIVEIQKITEITDKPEREQFKFSSYGSMLMLSYTNSSDSFCERSFVLYEGNYVEFNLSSIKPISNPFVYNTITTIPFDGSIIPAPKVADITTRTTNVGSSSLVVIDIFDRIYQEIYNQYNAQGYIHGALYAFAAYKLYDGTVIRNGDIFMLSPDIKETDNGEYLYRHVNGNKNEYYLNLQGFKPQIDISTECINSVKDIPFIESIVIYTSICNQIYDIESIFEKFSTDHPKATTVERSGKTFDSIRADVILDKRNFDIANKPFYAVAEVDFRSGKKSVTLDYNTHIRGIETKPIYMPNYSAHDIVSQGTFEYNGRMHRFSLVTKFCKGSLFLVDMNTLYFGNSRYNKVTDPTDLNIKFIYTLNIDGRDFLVSNEQKSFSYQLQGGNDSYRYLILPNMITYPDARARKLSIMICNSLNKGYVIKEFELKPAISNNYAYYQNTAVERVIGYNIISRPTSPTMSVDLPSLNTTVYQKNKMTVSENGNPYVFKPINTYTIGDDNNVEIVDINVPLDDLSDISFGNYPIYIFSTTGIYAMEKGSSEKTYNTAILINGDNVKSKTDSIAIGGRLFYITSSGITELKGRNGALISDILNGYKWSSGVSFEDYIKKASLIVIDTYKELVLFNKAYDYAFIYSIENKTWSTRDLKGEYIGSSLFVYGGDILDMSGIEEGLSLRSTIETQDIHIERDVRKSIDEIEIDVSGGYNMYVNGDTDKLMASGFMKNIFYKLRQSWRSFKISITGDIEHLNAVRIKYITKYK